MRGPFWGTREEELLREYSHLVEVAARLRGEIHALRTELDATRGVLAEALAASDSVRSMPEILGGVL